MRRPVNSPYTITTEFGVKDSYAKFGYHSGVDYAAPTGRPVYAPASGKIVYARMHQTGGNMVVIHDGQFYHRLLHNSTFTVREGDQVSEGQEVAKVGTTGLSTGPHSHWDINTRGVTPEAFSDFVSPARWLNGEFVVARPLPALEPYQRKVAEAGVNHRDEPNTTSGIRKEWPAGEVLDFKGFARGQSVSGNNIWFVGRHTGGYLWSGSFVDTDTHDLPDLTPAPVVDVKPPAPATPAVEYSQRPAAAGTWAIDVSSYQKSLDFKQLKEQGVEVAILKAGHTGVSYGGNVNKTDPTFYTYQKDARDAGMAVGYYWYCYFDEDADTEAARFVQSVGARVGSEPFFADVEEVNGANKEWLLEFVETVEELTGSLCHIYTYANYLQNHPWLHELLGNRKLWLAHYDIPPAGAVGDYIMHQYTSKGVLKGVGSSYIDLNLFLGTVDQFKKLGDIVPVVREPIPAPKDEEEPLPNAEPPAPLPTKDNNPIRPKVKAAALAGIITTFAIGLLRQLGVELPQGLEAEVSAGLTTLIMFLTAYLKRDGLSPK